MQSQPGLQLAPCIVRQLVQGAGRDTQPHGHLFRVDAIDDHEVQHIPLAIGQAGIYTRDSSGWDSVI
jgi:hypothetical protein